MYSWRDIEAQLPNLIAVDGGFSSAARGIVVLEDGTKLFVKYGTDENTNRWAKKEIEVYRFLEKHNFTHAPRLVAVNATETGFALAAYTSDDGWDWYDNWSAERLEATLSALNELGEIELNDEERSFLSKDTISQSKNGWMALNESPEKQKALERKLAGSANPDILGGMTYQSHAEKSNEYVFKENTLVHFDLRADNCAWNAKSQELKIVDWNWAQMGDKDIELAVVFTHVQKSGFNLSSDMIKSLNPDALHWMAGFWLNAAATPLYENGPENLRGLQLLAGITALELAQRAGL